MHPRPQTPLNEPLATVPPTADGWLWDVFCQVIDNFGDIGVCWRLSADLAARGHRVRLWLDDFGALPWMAPGALEGRWPGISVRAWGEASDFSVLAALEPAQVWIESFACTLPDAFVAARAHAQGSTGTAAPVWMNLEYLSAENFVERCHGLPSPVMSGPAKGWTKHFFYPGFTPRTGGLLREPGLLPMRNARDNAARRRWLQHHNIVDRGEALVSLFCYATAPVERLLSLLCRQVGPVHLLVTAGTAQESVEKAISCLPLDSGSLRVTYLPWLPQTEFDALLWACDLNFVRGEDSLVRALWAGRPFVWQIYPQDDGAHRAKLASFLEALNAPVEVRAWHAQWNRLEPWGGDLELPWGLPQADTEAAASDRPGGWRAWAQGTQVQLAQQTDLVTQLCGFVQALGAADLKQKTR